MKLPGEIAKEIREAHGVSQQELADFMTNAGCKTSRDAIRHGESTNYTDHRLLLFCKKFKIDDPVDTFLGGGLYSQLNEKGLQALNEYKALLLSHMPYRKQETVNLRLIPVTVSAGPNYSGEPDEDCSWVKVPFADVPSIYRPDDLMVAKVTGRSMEPELYDGDYIIFSHGDQPRNGRIIVCYYEYATLVKIYRSNGREAWLESLNEDVEPIKLVRDMVYYGEYEAKTTILEQMKGEPHIA